MNETEIAERAANIVTAAERVRKSKALKAKRDSAAGKGVTLVEGTLLAIKGDDFSVFVWDGTDWVPRLTGTITKSFS